MSTNERPFKRQVFGGYKRKAVDEHLAVVDASIADLREAVERAAEPEHQELVLRATRLAVEDVLQRAHDDAQRIRSDAETEAARLLADAYDIVAAREAVIDLRPDPVASVAADDDRETAAPVDADTTVATPDDVETVAEHDTVTDLTEVTDLTDAASAGADAEPVDPAWNEDLAKAIDD